MEDAVAVGGRILSTDDLSPEVREEIRARGGEVHEDTQYGPG